jgi:hypothetical protein
MAGKSGSSKSQELNYVKYKTANKQATNRRIKLEKLIKENPNNEQLVLALKDIKYRRGTPKTHVWDKNMIATASLFKKVTGKFDKLYFSTDPKVSHAAALSRNPNKFLFNSKKFPFYGLNPNPHPTQLKRPFSIMARAHDNQGNLVWA